MKNHIALLLIVIFPFIVYAQKSPLKYGKLSEEEIELSSYGNADAIVLYDYGTYSFDAHTGYLFFYSSRHLRIKILTENGIKYATQKIPFYDIKAATLYNQSRAYELRGQTININTNGKLQNTRLKIKDSHETGPDEVFNNMLTLNFKDVKVGSIIEYELKMPTIEIVNPSPWYLQYELPVLHSELRVISPEYINYSGKTYNVDHMDLAEVTHSTSLITYRRGSLNTQTYQIQFIKNNIPPAPIDTPNEDRMYIKIMLDRASRRYSIPGIEYLFRATNPEYKYLDRSLKSSALTSSGYILYISPTLETLPLRMLKDPDFGPPLNIYMDIQDTIFKLTKDIKAPEEKAWFIYNFISSNMDWNGVYRSYVEPAFSNITMKILSKIKGNSNNLNRSLDRPFEKQKGSNAEINFILINALRKAGFDANPVLTSTKSFSILDPEFFNMHQFNHVLARVEIDDKIYIMDANIVDGKPLFEQLDMNNVGLVIKMNEAFWMDIDEVDEP